MRTGYHTQQWRNNCVAVGLSSGFLEPLESTGIYLIEMANWALIDMLPRFFANAQPQQRYNDIMALHYENIVDFLKMHYCLSQRRDSQFWRDNTDMSQIPSTLAEKLKTWEDSVPGTYDFDRRIQCFSENNYQFVLFGMEWRGHVSASKMTPDIHAFMDALAVRRDRLKMYVTRDTDENSAFF
jgi:tryptophan halogenase